MTRHPGKKIVHLADACKGALSCGAPEKRNSLGPLNWTRIPERVTCLRCLAIYTAKVKRK